MTIRAMSVTITTAELPQTRSFYERHLGATVTFDCGWYVVLRLDSATAGAAAPEICLMEPRDGSRPFSGGVVINLRVRSADEFHARFAEAGVSPAIPLGDHPWGDRGFGVVDPAGAMLYFYHEIPPAREFEAFFVEHRR